MNNKTTKRNQPTRLSTWTNAIYTAVCLCFTPLAHAEENKLQISLTGKNLQEMLEYSSKKLKTDSVYQILGLSPQELTPAFNTASMIQHVQNNPMDTLYLPQVYEITPKTAKTIASFTGSQISLPHLSTISPQVATELADYKGALVLNAIPEMTPNLASRLSSFNADAMFLGGVKSLAPNTATILAKWSGNVLILDGVTTLSPSTANSLANFKGSAMSLNGLQKISPSTASNLAGIQTKNLALSGLKDLSPSAAANLSKYQGEYISLLGLQSISASTAANLAKFKGTINVEPVILQKLKQHGYKK